MKIKYFVLTTLIILTLSSCKKNSNNSSNILTNKIWKRALNDKNPSTNPQGEVIYYPVQNCEKDDTFKFSTDGSLLVNHGTIKCESNELQNETQTYSLDRTKKELIINGIKFTLAEESSEQIKYYSVITQTSGFRYLIFLLQ